MNVHKNLMLGFLALFMVSGLGVPASPVNALEKLEDQKMSEVTGEEGIRINLNLNIGMQSLKIDDADGYEYSGGSFQLGSGQVDAITISDGLGLPAELTGITFDVSGDNQVNFGFPSGAFTASVDEVYPADPSGYPMGPLVLEDVNFGKTNLKVAPN